MHMVLSLVMASMLTFSLSAVAKLPAAKVRRAVTKVIRAGDVNGLAAVLAQYGLTVNSSIGTGGYTLLHDAVVMGTPDLVKYMLDNEAAVNATTEYGFTPLDEAKAFDNPEMVALLEQAGAVHGEGSYLGGAPTVIHPAQIGDGEISGETIEIRGESILTWVAAINTGWVEVGFSRRTL